MKLYGLYSKKHKKLIAAHFTSDESYGTLVELTLYYDNDVLWTTPDKLIAETVCSNSSEWYNGSWTRPAYNKEYYGELVVVDLNEFESKIR